MERSISDTFADQIEATATNNNGNSHSFDEVAEATIEATPEEMVKDAEKAVKSESQEIRTPATEEKSENIAVQGAKNTSEKNNKDAAEEINEQVEAALVEEIKLLKAKRGDTEYDVAEDAVITVKVDGEDVEVPISELRNNYSGKVAWDKKFTEIGKEKQAFNEEKGMVERYINEFAQRAQSEDKTLALEYLAEISGQDPLAFRRSLRQQMFKEFQRFSEMNESEVKAYELNEENEFLRRQQESVQDRVSQQQSQMELRSKIDSLRETYSVTQEDLLNHYDSIVQQRTQQGLDPEPTIEDLENALVDNKASSSAEYLLGKVDSSLVSAEHVAAVKELVMRNQDWTEQDFLDVIAEGFGINAASNKKPSKKAVKAAKKETQSKEELSDLAKKTANFASFDDLDDLF